MYNSKVATAKICGRELYRERGNKMLLNKRYYLKIVNNLVNLSGEEFCLYDEKTGELVEFFPCCTVDDFINAILVEDKVVYVVDAESFEIIKGLGVELENIAVVSNIGVGRNGVPIASLFWAKNLNKKIAYVAKVA